MKHTEKTYNKTVIITKKKKYSKSAKKSKVIKLPSTIRSLNLAGQVNI